MKTPESRDGETFLLILHQDSLQRYNFLWVCFASCLKHLTKSTLDAIFKDLDILKMKCGSQVIQLWHSHELDRSLNVALSYHPYNSFHEKKTLLLIFLHLLLVYIS